MDKKEQARLSTIGRQYPELVRGQMQAEAERIMRSVGQESTDPVQRCRYDAGANRRRHRKRMFGTCYMCLRPCGPLHRLRRWLHPVPPTDPDDSRLLVREYSRCIGCARAGGPVTWWACGLQWPARGRHTRHRWYWSMRLCQWLHGLDAHGWPKHGSDGL